MDFKHTAYIGFGSNLGDRNANCTNGLDMLGQSGDCRVDTVSPLYSTEPVGYTDQDWFVNGVAKIVTSLLPDALLLLLKDTEKQAGRKDGGPRFGPRELDMDILFFDNLMMESSNLTVPHPRMHERRFVLQPLCDIAPELIHPVLECSMASLLENLEDGKKVFLTS